MVYWLSSDDPPGAFPPIDHSLAEPNGLVAAGGDLSMPRLLAAYERGIFPWYEEGQPVLWWSPDPRCVIYPDKVYVPRRLARTMRTAPFTLTTNRAFAAVVDGCASPRRYTDATWITSAMRQAYIELHTQGYAHSVEAWQDDELAGGIYGVVLGRMFFGESMFSRVRDASKIALVTLATALRQAGFHCIDCQLPSPHLFSLGAELITRDQFLAELPGHCSNQPKVTDWHGFFHRPSE